MKIHLVINPGLKLNHIDYDFDNHCLRSLEFSKNVAIRESVVIADELVLSHVVRFIKRFYEGPIFYCDDESFSYGVIDEY